MYWNVFRDVWTSVRNKLGMYRKVCIMSKYILILKYVSNLNCCGLIIFLLLMFKNNERYLLQLHTERLDLKNSAAYNVSLYQEVLVSQLRMFIELDFYIIHILIFSLRRFVHDCIKDPKAHPQNLSYFATRLHT